MSCPVGGYASVPTLVKSVPSVSCDALRSVFRDATSHYCSARSSSLPPGAFFSRPFLDSTGIRLFRAMGSISGTNGFAAMLKKGTLGAYTVERAGSIAYLVCCFIFFLLALILAVRTLKFYRARHKHAQSKATMQNGHGKLCAGRTMCGFPIGKESESGPHEGLRVSSCGVGKRLRAPAACGVMFPAPWSFWLSASAALVVTTVALVLSLLVITYFSMLKGNSDSVFCEVWRVFQGHFFGVEDLRTPDAIAVPWEGSCNKIKAMEGMLYNLEPLPSSSLQRPSSPMSMLSRNQFNTSRIQHSKVDQLCRLCAQVEEQFSGEGGLQETLLRKSDMVAEKAYTVSLAAVALTNAVKGVASDVPDVFGSQRAVRDQAFESRATLVMARALIAYATNVRGVIQTAIAMFRSKLDMSFAWNSPVLGSSYLATNIALTHMRNVDQLVLGMKDTWEQGSAGLRGALIALVVVGVLLGLLCLAVAGSAVALGAIAMRRRCTKTSSASLAPYFLLLVSALFIISGSFFLLSGVLRVVGVVGSDGCGFLEDTLLEEGRWSALPPALFKAVPSNTTDVDVILNTCLKRREDGDIAKALGLRLMVKNIRDTFYATKEKALRDFETNLPLDSKISEVRTLAYKIETAVNSIVLHLPRDIDIPENQDDDNESLPPPFTDYNAASLVPHKSFILNYCVEPFIGNKEWTVSDFTTYCGSEFFARVIGIDALAERANTILKKVKSTKFTQVCSPELERYAFCSASAVNTTLFIKPPSSFEALEDERPSHKSDVEALLKSIKDRAHRKQLLVVLDTLYLMEYFLDLSLPPLSIESLALKDPDTVKMAREYLAKHTLKGLSLTELNYSSWNKLFPDLELNCETSDHESKTNCRIRHIIDAWKKTSGTFSVELEKAFESITQPLSHFIRSQSIQPFEKEIKRASSSLKGMNCQFIGTAVDEGVRGSLCDTLMPNVAALLLLSVLLALTTAVGAYFAWKAYQKFVCDKSEAETVVSSTSSGTAADMGVPASSQSDVFQKFMNTSDDISVNPSIRQPATQVDQS